jgi:hypothetical protein
MEVVGSGISRPTAIVNMLVRQMLADFINFGLCPKQSKFSCRNYSSGMNMGVILGTA